jgi:uncharacterized protein YecE (DUF72 family)
MDYGRVPNVDRVDFTLPSDAAGNAGFLKKLREGSPATQPRILLGTAGWSDRGLLGRLYPRGTRSQDFLQRYAQSFPTNELNSTYYAYDPTRIAAWAAAVPDGFLFCPKLPSTVSHEREFEHADGEMEPFVEALQSFGKHLGRTFTVLPPSFGPHKANVLTAFLERYAPHLPLGVELRHVRWFSDAKAQADMFDVFEALDVTPMLTDVAGRRDALHMRLCSRDTMIRFVGNSGHKSDLERLDEWTERIGRWAEAGMEKIYFFLHQKKDHETIPLARHMRPRLAQRTGLPLPELNLPEETALRQGELF